MAERIHIVLGWEEKERFRRAAARQGKSLSEWMRDAARERLALAEQPAELETEGALRAFFVECDEREPGHEPDWAVHRAVMERSRGTGASPT